MARPVILSFGTIFAALNQDAIDIEPIDWNNLMSFGGKISGKKKDSIRKDKKFKPKDKEFKSKDTRKDYEKSSIYTGPKESKKSYKEKKE